MITKVKIDQVLYSVSENDGPILVDRHECKGSIDYNMNEIKILTATGDSQKVVTLAHEIVHGLIYERGLSNMIKPEDEETLVDEMGKGIIQIIRDNPELVDYIKG